MKQAERLVQQGGPGPAAEAVAAAVSSLDNAAQKRIIHRNNAARRKSRLMRKLNKAGAARA